MSNLRYITGRHSDFSEFREGIPTHLETGGFFLCTSGYGEVVVDMKQYRVKQWDLMVAFPRSFVQALHVSDDFDGVLFGVNVDILTNIQIPNKGSYISNINVNPSISLREEEAQKILALRESFLRESANKEHPLRKEIDESILKIMIYEIAALFSHSVPNTEQQRSKDDIIFNNFVVQLYGEVQSHRTLDYYAAAKSITPGHLSKVIKRVSGRTASSWISDCAIVNIKGLLQDKQLPIATIADRLNFPNASFLSQYFKKYTGQTPKEYRVDYFRGE
ncbi:MAG: helix-turn-helix transcriptional regulator [Rikenellaceae bacterium]